MPMTLPATVTLREADEVVRALTQALQGGGGDAAVTVDASALQHFDSSALAVLLECMRRAQAAGKSFTVRQAPAKLVDLARLYGVEGLLTLEPVAAAA